MDNLWFVTLAECKENMLRAEGYGYGLDIRRKAKGLPVIEKTFKRHEEEYYFWLDLYCAKLFTDEGVHAPLYVVEPRFEQEKLYDWWIVYFSYRYRGAKAEMGEIK